MTKLKDKKVPQVRFKGHTDDWKEEKLGEIFPITSAARVHKHEWADSGVPFFRSSDVVSAFNGTKNTKAFISNELYWELSAKIGRINKGDMLVTGGGSIGIPYLVPSDEPLYFKDADLLWFKIRGSVDSNLLYTFFSSPPFGQYVKNISHIGTIAHYTVEQAKNTPVCIPQSKTEQIKIGAYFRELDRVIGLHQRKHDKLVILKKAMLENMFPQEGAVTPEIRFKGFSEQWEVKKLEDLGDTYSGLIGKKKEDFGHGSARYVTYMGVFSNILSEGNTTEPIEIDIKQNQVNFGDVLFTTSSETLEEVGMSSVWIGRSENTYLNSFCFGFRPKVTVDPYFFAYNLRSPDFRKSIVFLGQGISRYNISKRRTMSLSISLPTLQEQQKIGTYFLKLDELILLHTIQLEKLKQLKSACLAKMFV